MSREQQRAHDGHFDTGRPFRIGCRTRSGNTKEGEHRLSEAEATAEANRLMRQKTSEAIWRWRDDGQRQAIDRRWERGANGEWAQVAP